MTSNKKDRRKDRWPSVATPGSWTLIVAAEPTCLLWVAQTPKMAIHQGNHLPDLPGKSCHFRAVPWPAWKAGQTELVQAPAPRTAFKRGLGSWFEKRLVPSKARRMHQKHPKHALSSDDLGCDPHQNLHVNQNWGVEDAWVLFYFFGRETSCSKINVFVYIRLNSIVFAYNSVIYQKSGNKLMTSGVEKLIAGSTDCSRVATLHYSDSGREISICWHVLLSILFGMTLKKKRFTWKKTPIRFGWPKAE